MGPVQGMTCCAVSPHADVFVIGALDSGSNGGHWLGGVSRLCGGANSGSGCTGEEEGGRGQPAEPGASAAPGRQRCKCGKRPRTRPAARRPRRTCWARSRAPSQTSPGVSPATPGQVCVKRGMRNTAEL